MASLHAKDGVRRKEYLILGGENNENIRVNDGRALTRWHTSILTHKNGPRAAARAQCVRSKFLTPLS